MSREVRRAGVAGVVGAGTALGVGELLAGLVEGSASPLAAVGSLVVDRVPPALEDLAIGLFGTSDKAALTIGTVIIALVIGWFTGRASLRRFQVGVVVFSGFGALGIVAGLDQPLISPTVVVVTGVLSAATGVATMGMLLQAAAEEVPTDGVPGDPGRRRFLRMTTAAAGGAVVAGGLGRRLLARTPETAAVAVEDPLGALIGPEHDFGLPGLTPILVPNRDFFRVDTALVVPRIDPAEWRVRVHGLVEREVTFDYDDLLAMDMVDRYVTIACVSNPVGGPLVGNARWTGVPLVEVLERAGVSAEATQLVGRSIDGWTAGFPTEVAFDGREALIAVAMNGETLPPKHGYPARLVVPGLYGYVSATKWLTEIEMTRWEEYDAYWVPRGWAKEAPVKTQSRIDLPRGGTVSAGPVITAGVAWAPLVGVTAVEVAVDGGPWEPAELTEALAATSWVQWRRTVELAPGDHMVAVRATDGEGRVQTEERRPPRPDGATGHHRIRVRAL